MIQAYAQSAANAPFGALEHMDWVKFCRGMRAYNSAHMSLSLAYDLTPRS